MRWLHTHNEMILPWQQVREEVNVCPARCCDHQMDHGSSAEREGEGEEEGSSEAEYNGKCVTLAQLTCTMKCEMIVRYTQHDVDIHFTLYAKTCV